MANINGVNPPVLNDQDYVDKISDSFTAVDNHDHSTGKGLPIAAGGYAAGSIVNADVSASAAITRSKLAAGTNYRILANNGSGVMSENAALTAAYVVYVDANGQLAAEAQLSKARGGSGQDNSSITFPASGILGTVPASGVVKSNGSVLSSSNVNLASEVTGTLPIANGGTGQTGQTAAFDALSPLTTKGDLISRDGTNNIRVGVGTNGQVLTADSGQASGLTWSTPANAPTQSYELSNLGIACSVGSSALTIALKQSDGSSDASVGSPIKIGFGSATATSGAYSTRNVTAALSIVVSSGSTLGHASARAHYFYLYALDNAGTVELAVSSVYYDAGSIVSTSAEGGAGAADSNSTIYSTTARSNVRIRPIARLKSTQTTAGTWAAVPTEVSLYPFEPIKISAIYSSNSGQSINNNSETRVNFEDYEEDTHNAVTTGAGTWVFTAPANRLYAFEAGVAWTSGTGFDEGEYTLLTGKKGSTYLALDLYELPASPTAFDNTVHNRVNRTVRLAAGETLLFNVKHLAGAATTLSTASEENWVCIQEVGF